MNALLRTLLQTSSLWIFIKSTLLVDREWRVPSREYGWYARNTVFQPCPSRIRYASCRRSSGDYTRSVLKIRYIPLGRERSVVPKISLRLSAIQVFLTEFISGNPRFPCDKRDKRDRRGYRGGVPGQVMEWGGR